MSDRLIWSSRMTQDYLKGLSDEEKHNALLDRGYDEEHLAGANLDDFIDRDEYMWEDDADDFYNKIAPMINRQTNGFVIAVNKDDPQADIVVCQPEDLVTEMMDSGAYSAVQLYDVNGNVEAEYYDKNGHNALTVELFAVPNNEPDQVKFVQEIMPTFIQDAKDQMIDDEENENPLDDYASYLMDYDILQDYVDKDRLKKFGQHIRPDLHEAVVNEGISFPKELEEAKSNGIGVQNADKFIRYLANNDRTNNGPFNEDSIVNNDGAVRLFSQTSDITYTFTDDGGVVVEGEDEELGNLEEYFDTLDDFVKWCQAEAISLGSDVGCYDMERYLSGGGEEEVEEALTEEVVTEAKKVNTEALAEELEEIKEDFDDFGPDGFYAVPYESFKREFPEFTKNVVESFLTNYVEISPKEMNDPEVLDAWKSGDLITDNDWQTLFEGAEKVIAGNTPGWKDIYKKYYTEEVEESLDEGKDCEEKIEEGKDCADCEEKPLKEASNMDKLKAHYGKKFGEELDHNPNGDEMKGQVNSVLNDLMDLQDWAEESEAPETEQAAKDAQEVLNSREEILRESFDNWTDAYALFTACVDRFYPDTEKIDQAAQQIYEIFKGNPEVEEAWKRWNDKSSVEEPEDDYDESLNEAEEDYLVAPGDMEIAKQLEKESLEKANC